MCQSELTECFAELTESTAELSEFSLPKRYSQNSSPVIVTVGHQQMTYIKMFSELFLARLQVQLGEAFFLTVGALIPTVGLFGSQSVR